MELFRYFSFFWVVISTMGYSRKKSKWGVEDILLKTLLEIFIFFTLPLEIADKTKLSPWIFHKIVLDPMEIPHYSFLVTPGNSTLFLINHWKFHMLSLYTLGYPPPCLDFSRNSPIYVVLFILG